ncbi:hypothetical protein BH23ACT4_BH23ACT4_03660 [soil metagenome]
MARQDPETKSMSHGKVRELASKLIDSGFHVFPTLHKEGDPNDKKPGHGGNGFHDATDDLERFEEMLRTVRIRSGWHLGLGVHPGASGHIVFDPDVKDGGVGLKSLAWIESVYGEMPGRRVRTPSGGLHVWMKLPAGYSGVIGNKKAWTDIDTRCHKGYVIAPGVTVPWGSWTAESGAIAEIPAVVLKEVEDAHDEPKQIPQEATPGDRHETLVSLAASMWGKGLDCEAVLAALRGYNQEQCKPPKPDSELVDIVEWVTGKDGGPPPTDTDHNGNNGDNDHGRRWASTDSDNAARFINLHGDLVRYIPEWDRWLGWKGKRWHLDHKQTLMHELAKDVAKAMLGDVPNAPNPETFAKSAARALSRSSIANMVYLARGIAGVPLAFDQLDADPWLLGVRNGVINLHTGELRDADPADLMTMQAPVTYKADAECPRWDKAIAEWFPDPEVRAYVQRLTGSCLIGTQREHLFVIHHGHGANGKGTYIRAVESVLGPYATTPHLSLLVDDKNTQHDTVKAQLFRTRLAVATETERRVRLREAQIKNLTGGDRILARRLYEDPWAFDPSHTLWLVTNHLPEIAGRDAGIWRRIRVIPWTATFTSNTDLDLDRELRNEKPGILRWLVEGCRAYLEQGLAEPDAITAATITYKKSEDVITNWMTSSGLVFDPEKSINAAELTDLWRAWCETHLGTVRRFNETADHLANNGCRSHTSRPQVDGKRRQKTVWIGVGYGDGATPGHPLSESNSDATHMGIVSGEGSPGVAQVADQGLYKHPHNPTNSETASAEALETDPERVCDTCNQPGVLVDYQGLQVHDTQRCFPGRLADDREADQDKMSTFDEGLW